MFAVDAVLICLFSRAYFTTGPWSDEEARKQIRRAELLRPYHRTDVTLMLRTEMGWALIQDYSARNLKRSTRGDFWRVGWKVLQ
jgi:hypothetical protein